MNSESTRWAKKCGKHFYSLLASYSCLQHEAGYFVKNWETSSTRVILHQRVHHPYVTRGIKKENLQRSAAKVKRMLLTILKSPGVYQMEPPSPIQALGVNPFPSGFIIRTVPRGDFARRRWEEPITTTKWHCYFTSWNSRKSGADRPNKIIS